MKHRLLSSRWLRFVVALAAAYMCFRYAVRGVQVGDDNLQGMTEQQLRDRYGEPDVIVGEYWIYYRGWFGNGTAIRFTHGVVSEYGVRADK